MASGHILIVEDENKIALLLRDYLEKAGYKATCLERGDEVVDSVMKDMPALILLDIMLPGMDGMEVCRKIRKLSNVPIIMLTAKVEEVDRIVGLELGADDYICKPFSAREVVARVNAVLRRVRTTPEEEKLLVGQILLDEKRHEVMIGSHALDLTPSEFGLLRAMMTYPERVFSRNELINQVQGYEFDGYDRTIDTHIKNLRKKIRKALPDQEIISTVYGIGYKLSSPTK
jgi:two-component system response regulator BaeR